MKCPKCDKYMKTDVENEKYICNCGNEVKWQNGWIKDDKD